ncbi:hypothetical protein [Megalodesulfovibrio gigas]|uniref:Uncharacterized protein n=1 Tax=Megalodesulfovibrio gigas (strain ATCC 19364 / DSM 1382 / NCIMB 9332 / VKM B-1759) TaxID=1121448 RepID=T2GBY1_MEGG1|nr:hypothetical protein [Megalodesulfovibrio gigas]AGW13679.1 hypothetical protein DGI_1893 [Megalodesulfovibrio gigas DSM 1382 = ATCC 19364]
MTPWWNESSLKRAHPFYGCVTGQALFYLLQEHELPEARIQALLDQFEAGKAVLVDLLNAAPPTVRLRVAAGACAQCAALDGMTLPGDHPELVTLLPPYGLGCRVTAEAVDTAGKAASVMSPCLPTIPRPHPLCCVLDLHGAP